MGREYASIDSLSHAIEILSTADSLTANSKDIDVKAAIDNALGNIYVMQNKYDEAKKFFYKALEGREKMPNYMALIDLYIASDSISQAKGLLQKIPQDDPTYTYSIKYLYYQIYKSEKKYEKAGPAFCRLFSRTSGRRVSQPGYRCFSVPLHPSHPVVLQPFKEK